MRVEEPEEGRGAGMREDVKNPLTIYRFFSYFCRLLPWTRSMCLSVHCKTLIINKLRNIFTMISKLFQIRRMDMKKNRNKTLALIWTLALVMMGGGAFGQRDNGGGNGGNATTEHVTVGGSVFGGGNKANVKGSCTVLINQDDAEVTKDVYGGGALADVNVTTPDSGPNQATSGASTTVTILDGVIRGNIYGGGLGQVARDAIPAVGIEGQPGYVPAQPALPAIEAKVYGEVTVNIGTGIVDSDDQATSVQGKATIGGSVFGCNNINGTPLDDVMVNIFKTYHTAEDTVTNFSSNKYAIDSVFGGGNKASYVPASSGKKTTVHVYTCNNTIQKIYGGGNAADVGTEGATGIKSSTNIIIDGGRIEWVFGGGNGAGNHDDPTAPNYNPGANIYDNVNVKFRAGDIQYFFGGSNEKGLIAGTKTVNLANDITSCLMGPTNYPNHIGEFYGGNNKADIEGDLSLTMVCPTGDPCKIDYLFGGSRDADISGDVTLTVEGGDYDYVFGGNNLGGTISGNVTLNLYGGTIHGAAFGGNNQGGEIKKMITVNLIQQGVCSLQVDTIYGGGCDAAYAPDSISGQKIVSPVVNLWNGTVGHTANNVTTPGCVFGGGKGETAVVTAHPKVIIGDTIATGSNANTHIGYQARVLGNVFGGGNAAYVDGIDSVLMLKFNNVVSNLFGGGNAAYADSAVVMMTAGTVDTIFGGGNLAGLGNETSHTEGYALVEVSDGTIQGGIYGGSNKEGTVYGDITLNVIGGTIGTDATHRANIHGDGYGNATASSGNVELFGDLYGGSGFGHVNASTFNTTMVNILNGEITGDVYGGGLGESTSHGGSHNYEALVKGNVEVYFGKTIGETLYGKAKMHTYTSGENTNGGRVFGCNNANGTPLGTVSVTINSTDQSSGTGNNKVFAIQGVYGGGNLANYIPGDATTTTGSYPTVTINNCLTSVRDVFGGGNAAAVTKTNVVVNGGDINRVFAGGNGTSGHAHVGYNSNVEIPGETTSYGPGTANVTVKGGTVNQVFGGSNSSGLIRAIGSVDVDKEGSCDMVIGEVYGGGNEAAGKAGVITIGCTGGTNEGIGDVYGGAKAAAVTGDITLNITGGKIGRVFGGNNVSGAIDGDITVNVEWTGSCPKDSIGYVYGGGNQAPYIQKTTGHPSVNIYNGTVSYNVYGGGLGNTATVTGTPTVTIGDMRDSHETNVATVSGDVYGGGDLASVTGGTSVTIQKAGTTATNVFGGGNKASVSGATSVAMTNGTVTALFGGGNEASVGSSVVNMSNGSSTNVYGGGNKAGVDGTAQVTVSGGSAISDGLYGGCNTSGTVGSNVTVNVTGGTIGNSSTDNGAVYGGGLGKATKVKGNVAVTIGGGIINNDVYGGSAKGLVNCTDSGGQHNGDSKTEVTLNAGTINGSLYGGGHGLENESANVWGPVFVTVNGGSATNVYGCNNLNGAPQDSVKVFIENGTVTLDVFGGGNMAAYDGCPVVHVDGGQARNIFGGGNEASVDSTTVVMTAGTVDTIFGGGNKAGLRGAASVTLTTGSVRGGVYGGCNSSGSVAGNIFVNIDGGTVGVAQVGNPGDEGYVAGQRANVHGGGYGSATGTAGNVEVYIAQAGATSGATIYGDVYGGSALGNVNGTSANTTHHTSVTMNKGTIHGDLYGGGLGNGSNAAMVYSPVQVTVNSGTVTGSVYGCNNANGAPQSTVKVDIYGTDAPASGYALGNVFGGGNQAAYTGTPEVTIHNCDNSIEYVYGGGNKASVAGTNVKIYGGNTIGNVFGGGNGEGVAATTTMVSGNVNAYIYGGTIGKVFAGNNSSGLVTGNMTLVVNKQQETGHSSCDMKLGEVYGGGNMAAGNAGSITIGCTGTWTTGTGNTHEHHNSTNNRIGFELEGIGTVYGGANQANVTNDIVLNINSGIIENVFGGNNTSGAISGTIQVNINKDESNTAPCPDHWYVGDVYGGGNHAAYGGSPDVNIMAGTVSGNVYGGGNDITTAAAGILNSDVVMTGGTVLGGIYGGCNLKGTVTGYSEVSVYGGTIGSQDLLDAGTVAQVFGGGLGENTKVNGNVTVTISRASGEAPTIYGDVYGGSALGQVNTGSSDTTTVNILDGTLMTKSTISGGFTTYTGGNVFGGGLGVNNDPANADKGKVNGKVIVNIGAGTPHPTTPFIVLPTGLSGNATIGGNVYGCNNSGGSPQDTVTVNVFQTAHTAKDLASYLEDDRTYAIANVFGGGNEADYSPAAGITYVNIYTCDNTIERLFGGGNAANTPEIVTHIQGGRFFQVFGGGNGERGRDFAANVNGDVTLNLHGGNIGENYGGSNQNGAISGDIHTNVLNDGPCESVTFDEFFCGGYAEDVFGDLVTTIACSDAHYTSLYGGCNQANVYGNIILNLCGGTYTNVFGGSKGVAGTNGISADILKVTQAVHSAHPDLAEGYGGNVTLNLYGGTIENVFGGSNINGNIEGNITVNVIDSLSTSCPLYITNIYGGSNLTDYVPDSVNHVAVSDPDRISPVVNLVHAKYGISGNVYGGSKGNPNASIPTKLMTNPLVNIGYDATSMNGYIPATYLSSHPDWLAAPRAIVAGSVFGGGDAAKVVGNTAIFLRNRAKVFGNVYGGGNMGEVTGDTKVIVNGENQ